MNKARRRAISVKKKVQEARATFRSRSQPIYKEEKRKKKKKQLFPIIFNSGNERVNIQISTKYALSAGANAK